MMWSVVSGEDTFSFVKNMNEFAIGREILIVRYGTDRKKKTPMAYVSYESLGKFKIEDPCSKVLRKSIMIKDVFDHVTTKVLFSLLSADNPEELAKQLNLFSTGRNILNSSIEFGFDKTSEKSTAIVPYSRYIGTIVGSTTVHMLDPMSV